MKINMKKLPHMVVKNIQFLPLIEEELRKIGVSEEGIKIMSPKGVFRIVKLEDIDFRFANIIKQEMLSIGGEAALSKSALSNFSSTGVLLMATLSQYEKLKLKLKRQPFRLKYIAEKIAEKLSFFDSLEHKIKLKNKIYTVGKKTLLMGILNVTPDSFYNGGKYFKLEDAISKAKKMNSEGADIIDVGGESTRPFAKKLSEKEELERVLPVVKILAEELKIPISVDTYKAKVAEKALELGAAMINDVSALRFDRRMVDVAVEYDVPVVLMHMKGTPRSMQKNPYYEDVVWEISKFLDARINYAIKKGIKEENIIIDPGIGFGKRTEDNLEILKKLSEFRTLGKPILIGVSRKSFIGNVLNLPPEERLEGSLASTVVAILHGANIVRTHDVKETLRAVKIANAIMDMM